MVRVERLELEAVVIITTIDGVRIHCLYEINKSRLTSWGSEGTEQREDKLGQGKGKVHHVCKVVAIPKSFVLWSCTFTAAGGWLGHWRRPTENKVKQCSARQPDAKDVFDERGNSTHTEY